MSGTLKTLNSKRKSRKIQLLQSATAARASKKAKLSQDVIPCTPETTVHLEPKLFCATCSSQKIIDSNQITITQWEDVDQVKLGRDSKRDDDYQYVLGMLRDDMIHVLSHRLSHKLRIGNETVTVSLIESSIKGSRFRQLAVIIITQIQGSFLMKFNIFEI
jgi:hypothetical protein